MLFRIHEIWTGKYVIRSCFPLSFNKETSLTKFLLTTQMEIVHFLSKVVTSKCLNLSCFHFQVSSIYWPFLFHFFFVFVLPFLNQFSSLSCLSMKLCVPPCQFLGLVVFQVLFSYSVSWPSSALIALQQCQFCKKTYVNVCLKFSNFTHCQELAKSWVVRFYGSLVTTYALIIEDIMVGGKDHTCCC